MDVSPYLPTGASFTDFAGIPRLKPLERNSFNHIWFREIIMDFVFKNFSEKSGVKTGCVISRDGVTYDIVATAGSVRINKVDITVNSPATVTCSNDGWYLFYVDESGDHQSVFYDNDTIQGASTPDNSAIVGYVIRESINIFVKSFFNELDDPASTGDLQDEIDARVAADLVLQGNIDDEEIARGVADTTLQGNIDTEETTRGNDDTTLQGNIDTEATTRGNADTTLTTNKMDKSQDLNDVANKATSRTNLDVYKRSDAVSIAGNETVSGQKTLSAGVKTGNIFYAVSRFNIGPWNMASNHTKQVTIALPFAKVFKVFAEILNDTNNGKYDLVGGLYESGSLHEGRMTVAGGIYYSGTTTTQVNLYRYEDAFFDYMSAQFDYITGDYNRGWITVFHEP